MSNYIKSNVDDGRPLLHEGGKLVQYANGDWGLCPSVKNPFAGIVKVYIDLPERDEGLFAGYRPDRPNTDSHYGFTTKEEELYCTAFPEEAKKTVANIEKINSAYVHVLKDVCEDIRQ